MHNLLVVSDVHLCRLRPRMFEGGQRHFAPFLRKMTREPAHNGEPWRLVINGDFLDFDHQASSIAQRGPEAASQALFDEMASEQGQAFDALAAFIAAGHELVFIPGNHDVDLLWPSLRARFDARLSAAGRVQHHDWFYYEPGRVYLEHGQQYDPDTSIVGMLWPFDTDSGEQQLRRNLATWWIAEFCPHITELAYHVDHTRSALYYIPTVIRKLAWRAPVLWAKYLDFVRRTMLDAGGPRALLPQAHAARRTELAAQANLDEALLRTLESHMAKPRLASRLQTAGRLHAVPATLLPLVLGLGASAAATASAPWRSSTRSCRRASRAACPSCCASPRPRCSAR